jgi:predicted RNA methylase
LLSCITLAPNDKVLDLGCGYCLIGIYAAKIMGAERVWNAARCRVRLTARQGNIKLKRAGRARVLSLRPREKSARRADRLSRGGVCGGGGQFRVDYEVEDFSLGQAH